ncbi:MAG: DnaJ subfamily C member 13, partial [Paramarteilia canceri]
MIKFPQSLASLYIVESVHTCLETTSDSLESHLAPLNTLGLLVVFLAECIRSKKTDSVLVAMKLIQRLSSLTKLLSELFSKGILIHLLLLYVDTNAHYDIRQKTLELLSVMLSDKLVGPRVALFLPRFVPKAFVFAITDAPETSLVLIDKDHDTPEMLWNAAVKNNVQTVLKRLHDDLYSHQKRNSEYIFSLPEDFRISFDDDPNGIFIGDVNLRRYAKSPDYILRKPDEFMINFMNFWNIEIAKILESEIAEDSDLEKLDLINTVSEHFFAMHSNTLSLMQQIGTLSRLVELLNSKHSKHILTSSIILIKSAVKNIDCADQLIKLQILKNISQIFSDIETVHLKSLAEFFTTIAEYDKPEFSFQ